MTQAVRNRKDLEMQMRAAGIAGGGGEFQPDRPAGPYYDAPRQGPAHLSAGRAGYAGEDVHRQRPGGGKSQLVGRRVRVAIVGKPGGQCVMNAGAGMMSFSDVRLKRSVEYVGRWADRKFYKWTYIWGEKGFGVLAHENPDMVVAAPAGYAIVDYGRL